MEHPCPKCGHPVEDGKPFCKTCSAPQIRVLTAEDLEQTPAPEELPEMPEAPHMQQEPQQQQWPSPEAILAERSLRSYQKKAAVNAGIIGVLGSLILSPLFMLAAGGISVTLYHRKVPKTTVPASLGFRMGILTGFVAACCQALVVFIGFLSTTFRHALREQAIAGLRQSAEWMSGMGNSELVTRQMQDRINIISTDAGLFSWVLLGLLFIALIDIFLSGVGGAIGAALFGQRPQEK